MSVARSSCLVFVISLALAAAASATPLDPPLFYAYAYAGACPSNVVVPPVEEQGDTPAFATVTSEGTVGGSPAYYTGTAEAEAGSPPWVRSDSIALNLPGLTCPNKALAELQYQADLTPIALDVPRNIPIPITVTSYGSVNCIAYPPTAPILQGSLVTAEAKVEGGPWGGFAEVECDGDETEPGIEDEFFGSWSGSVLPLVARLSFRVVVKTAILRGTGGAEAYADPRVEIDPSFTVEYKGQQVPAASLYTVEFTPGVLPEPAHGTPVALGVLALLARWRRRRARTSEARASLRLE